MKISARAKGEECATARIFQVKAASPHRDVGGKPVYFCCESCAAYFSDHNEHVIATRNLSPTPLDSKK